MMTLTAHIVVPDAAAASDWYEKAFGAREQTRIPLPGGKVMTVELRFGQSALHVASEFTEMGILSPLCIGGTATVLQIEVEDVDSVWERALQAGAQPRHPLADQFWGARQGQLTDPFGHRWNVAQPIREVPHEEIAAAAAQAFGAS
jgi:PhnB protein